MQIRVQIRRAAALLCFFAVFSLSAGERISAAPLRPSAGGEAAGLLLWREEGDGGPAVDLSHTDAGCVAAAFSAARRLKFQVVGEKGVCTYDMASDGTQSVFPLLMGDGAYRFRILENVTGDRYAEVYAAKASVTLTDALQPFLHPNEYVNYTASSACVRAAKTLAPDSADSAEIAAAAGAYIREHVSYDAEKAASVGAGYLPDPDATLETGRGICFDYASLAAAMLRSRGIPAKIVVGRVGPEGLYHAWNEFYAFSDGEIEEGYTVSAGTWNRIDLTCASAVPGGSLAGANEIYRKMFEY